MNLIDHLKRLGTQMEAAARIGVAQTTVSAWLRGESLPTNLAVPALATALGMPVEDLRALITAEREARAAAKAQAQAQAEPKVELCREHDEHGVDIEYTEGSCEFIPHPPAPAASPCRALVTVPAAPAVGGGW
jgi:transcriptional regulator with XRE-family HTH domain